MKSRCVLGMIACVLTALSAGALGVDPSEPSPEATVQARLEAYNHHGIEAFLATYSDHVELYEHPARLLARGQAALRARYAQQFGRRALHAEVFKRIVMGDVVIDHERLRSESRSEVEAIAIYEVRGARIVREWLILGPNALDGSP